MKRFFSWVVFLVLFLFIGLSYSLFIPLQLTVENSIYELKSGYSLRTIAKDLAQKKIIREPYSFILMGKLLGIQSHIKAGSYEFRNGMSAYELLTKIAHGDAIDYEVKIIDGMNFSQLKKELAQNPNLSHQMDHLTTEEVLQQLAGNNSSLEGVFYPDTYFFNRGDSDIQVLKRAKNNMDSHLRQLWQNREQDPLIHTPYEALILASLVEKESAVVSEQPLIAAVFLNRLKIGMRLQTDPTVIFGLGSRYSGKLHHQDLKIDNVYNTYTRHGLPPTPIAYPSKTALQAVLHPAHTDDLYFVAKGDGAHYFSKTLAQHNQAVLKYQHHPSQ
ncbi:MAG: hypothetical protein B7Z60_02545 [Ferrovum sp. 37-45-19]|nr:MAG: hypothetical protein B7Z65_02050 [Ferrovum sp. 21-44-67]OYV95087.1 MAG: hypothetical protein B7Z60_02545 [Ferrovum sp. 37-45-19]HQU06589.1 endolytic transglycosylase MltG [Ferrovaceae bacterium]